MINNKVRRITVKNKWTKNFIKSPLIVKEGILNIKDLQEEGIIIDLYDKQKRFIGKGYYGNQNKGAGWIVSRDSHTVIDVDWFKTLFQEAKVRRDKYYQDDNTTAFRVFNGEGDGLGGITVDYFDGYYLVTWYNLGIFNFKEAILQSLEEVFEPIGIYEKKRFAKKGQYVDDHDFVQGNPAPEPLIVLENGIKFAVYLDDGPMVGVFLDQKDVRKQIRDHYAKGKTVLNTFSYTGAFSVAAALGGATKTTSVDLANRSRSKTKEQFEINTIDPDTQEIIVEDVFDYFRYANRKGKAFNLVILDPPSFARSKKRTFSAAKDYVDLMKDAIGITESKGVIVASTNHSNFNMTKFKKFIEVAFREMGEQYQVLESYSLPDDFHVSPEFPEGDYLKVVFVKKLS